MPLIDDRGRLFGKLNLIDAVVMTVGLGMIPLAYGASQLFRVPVPKITSIQPSQVMQGEPSTLQVTGEDLRPFLRARVGEVPSMGFLVQSPTVAEIKVPELPPGVYDLALFDEARELFRMPGALTVVAPAAPPPPPPLPPPSGPAPIELRAIGEFVGIAIRDAQRIRVGMQLKHANGERAAEVLAVGVPEVGMQRLRAGGAIVNVPTPGEVQVPAVIRISCVVTANPPPFLGDCMVGATALAQDVMIALPVSGADDANSSPGQIQFVVREVLSSTAPPISSSARVDIQVVGQFFGLTLDDLRFIEAGSRFERWRDEPFAEVLAVGTPEPGMRRVRMGGQTLWTPAAGELRAHGIVRMSCVPTTTENCQVEDTILAENTTIELPVPRRSEHVKFLISEIRSADAAPVFPSVRTAIANVRVRFVAGQEVLDVMTVGDVDVSGSDTMADADRAVLTGIGGDQRMMEALTNTQGLRRRSLQVEESVLSFTGTVRVPVVFTRAGWSYRDQVVKVGAAFTFETLTGAMMGWVLGMELSGDQVNVVR